jgi:arylsulfatase A-like enzyme
VRDNDGSAPIRADEVTIAQMLKQAGYATGGFGKWGIGDRGTSGVPEKHGFDLFFGYYHQVHAHSYYPNYLIRNSEKVPLAGNTGHAFKGETFSQYLIHDEALAFIREHAGKRPFFAYLPYTPPHAYYGMPEDDPAYLQFRDRDWPGAPQHHHNPAVAPADEAKRYAAFMAMMDRQIGDILALLEDTGVDDNTIVFLSGDNGGNASVFRNDSYPEGFFAPNRDPRTGVTFRGGKGDFYEGGLRVPYLVRWPGKIRAGSVSDHLGYFPDVMPTLAEVAGAVPPEGCDGISFLPTLLGTPEKQRQHEYLYWERGSEIAVRHGDRKAVRPKGADRFELYDLSVDISESRDLAEEHPDVLARLEGFARDAHVPPVTGEYRDRSLGFKGHGAK